MTTLPPASSRCRRRSRGRGTARSHPPRSTRPVTGPPVAGRRPSTPPGTTVFAAAWLVNALALLAQIATVILFFYALNAALTESDIDNDTFFWAVAAGLVCPLLILIGIGLTSFSAARHHRHRPAWSTALIVFTVVCASPAFVVLSFLFIR
ncbi:hypothetical protein MUG78_09245 [Gordonia alkaliphila]|uniref:hypothetical protein n=1 Tax=Gordonia alkaliphila TaxID=1053547 RepID=UPI001FF24D25|nr:hypothetical protein [Gordonia alkaliphila]MCK0439641.1 hypothetical protein [Gordonia alkaliphila]